MTTMSGGPTIVIESSRDETRHDEPVAAGGQAAACT
jgi:hypothetical protein